MNTKLFLALLALGIIAGAMIAYAVNNFVTYNMPQSATVPQLGLTMTVENITWLNNTPINWGNSILPGNTYLKSLNVTNPTTVPIKVYFMIFNLPEGWIETWASNGTTLQPQTFTNNDIQLTVTNASPSTYNWQSYIRGEAQ